MSIYFKDFLGEVKGELKKVVSVRDGIQEYLGAEIGKEPFDKVFKIYRSPETIKEASAKMIGIPLTDDHIELEDKIPLDKFLGVVITSEIKPLENNDTLTTISVENEVFLKNMLLLEGKNQLSLGYYADLVESEDPNYDFEQVNIIPHHLAIVENARCGDSCKFKDEGGKMSQNQEPQNPQANQEQNNQESQNQESKQNGEGEEKGGINLEKVNEVVAKLPEVIAKLDLDEVKKLIPILEDAINKAREKDPSFKDNKPNFKDTKEFKDAVMQYGNERAEIILKAQRVLGDVGAVFADKSNLEIMKEVLKAKTGKEFKDEEVPVAFKMLESFTDYSNFGEKFKDDDDEILKLADKEL